jgi:hypothetical protein
LLFFLPSPSLSTTPFTHLTLLPWSALNLNTPTTPVSSLSSSSAELFELVEVMIWVREPWEAMAVADVPT